MTDLLHPPGAGTRGRAAAAAPLRPLAVGAAVAGAAAALSGLLVCAGLALVGWFASDAGGHGTTRDALRVATDGWLLGHGAHLHLVTAGTAATISVVPLGLTLLFGYLAYRFGRWAAGTSAVEDARTLLLGALVLAGVYALVTLVCAVLAATAHAEPSLPGSFVGGFLVALVGGGSGLARGAGDVLAGRRLPAAVRAVGVGALSATLLLLVAASVLLTVALLVDLGSAANVLSRLHTDVAGGLLYTVVVAAVAPNAVLLTGSYLLGPGFAVGTGTLVSPAAVTLAPVPAFPLLAALPAAGPPAAWLSGLVALPVVAGVLGTLLMLHRDPVLTYESGAARGLGAGVLAGLLSTLLVVLAGGSAGPGRMADVGAAPLPVLVSATVAMGVGGLAGGIAATWWTRRR